MFDFSEDEWLFTVVATVGAVVGIWRWYGTLFRVSRLHTHSRSQAILIMAPLVSLVLVTIVLQILADPVYVAGHPDYMLLFLAGAACWIFGASEVFSLLGVSTRDDAMRRRNPAAAIAVSGGVVGVALAYAGSNIGNGPTIWTTLLPALVATAALLAFWLIVEIFGGAFEAITLDHDVAAGIRVAAFLISAGTILGRAMAGDWFDWNGTFTEFVKLGWPAALLIPAMVSMNRKFAPTPQQPDPEVSRCGWQPAFIMLALTVVYLVYLGIPPVAPTSAGEP